MAKKADKQQASALDEVRRHVRIFGDLGRVASESADEDGFLDQVVVQVARAVEIDHVKVLKYRRREADLLIAAGFGWKEGVVRSATLSADLRSPPGRSFQTAQPVVIKNFQAQDDFVHSGLLQDHGIVSLVNVPVLIEGAAWGVLEVDSTRPRDFSQDTIEFLTATAALIGAFLQSHRGELSEAARLAAATVQAQSRANSSSSAPAPCGVVPRCRNCGICRGSRASRAARAAGSRLILGCNSTMSTN